MSTMYQDFCNVPLEYKKHPQPLYANMSRALNATGRPIAFSMCEWGVAEPWTWGDAIAQSWREAGDHTGVWDSTKSVIRSSAAVPPEFSGRPYGWNDMDMLETGCYEQCAHANGQQPRLTSIEYKTEFSMWAISASPLQITTTIMNCTQAPLTSCAVALTKQNSDSACTLGTSFGCNLSTSSIWTNIGCRGEFTCNGEPVSCDVAGVGLHECPCPGAAPVVCKGWLSDLQKEILLNTEVLAINQDVTKQGRPIYGARNLTVWLRDLSDGSKAVALYNEDDAPVSIGVKFEDIGWAGGTVKGRDLWLHIDVGPYTDSIPARSVAPHETVLLRLHRQPTV